jgi:predicted transcriptional regulator
MKQNGIKLTVLRMNKKNEKIWKLERICCMWRKQNEFNEEEEMLNAVSFSFQY